MKQKVYSILLVMLMSMAANVALAYDAEIDGIYYDFNGTEATVTSGDNNYSGFIVIPSTVNYNDTDYRVTNIGEQAFYYCTGLTSITIPNSVTSIGYGAFGNCINLTSINIPNSVTTIDDNPFSGCSSLASIIIEEGNTNYDSRNNCNAIIETSSNTLIAGCKNTTIPNSVTSIGWESFSGCRGLTSITIPNSVATIGEWAFQDCCGLTSIVVEEGNANYDSRNNCNAIIETSSNTLITGCMNTIIPNSVTSIRSHAFEYCYGLTSITIPNSVICIGGEAFYSCSGLTSITIPNSVTTIGEWAFAECKSLTSITIPSSVTNIGYNAFAWCNGLTTFTIDGDNVSFASEDGVLFNKAKTILLQYPIAKSETAYVIPSSVKRIESGSFIGCCNLTSITIPNSVTSIGKNAFYYCSGLITISIPNSVTSIESCTFQDCNSLTSVTIPSSVTSIGEWAFANCSDLTDIYCNAKTVPTTHSDAFIYTPISNITLHVPGASIEAYKATEPWSGFKEIVICNDVDVENQAIVADNSTMMEINVSNYDTNLVGFQMDLTLPNGVDIDKTDSSLSSRITDEEQKLTIGKLESGAYRITSTSLSLIPISGNDGTLLSLKLSAEDGCIGGQATISNIIFSTAESEKVIMSDKAFDISILYNLTYKVDGEEYKTSSVAYGTALTLEAEPTKEGYTFGGWSEIPETMPNHDVEIIGNFYLFGDVNADKDVDVVDVVDIARFVVATPSVSFREKLADLNFDNTVNIADAVTLVNHIAGDQNFARAMESFNYDQCLLQLVNNGANTLSLCLDGNADFTAFQFEVELPENTDITAMRINGLRMNNHQILYNKVSDNRYRVAVLSLSNTVFKGNEGELLNISIEGQPTDEISIHNILFVTKNGTGITFDDISLSETVTGIANVDANEGNNVVFDLQGRKLSKAQRGVNIVNGKKVVVK